MSDTAQRIGKIIRTKAERDAIHVAVAPAVANEQLEPGTHVGLAKNGKATKYGIMGNVGIVDPFLAEIVQKGDRFYIFLYPGSITSLRHEWTHEAFPDSLPSVTPDTDKNAINPSVQWIKDYADSLGVDYIGLMNAAKDYLDHDEYYEEGSTLEDKHTSDEFWEHYGIVTGTYVSPERRANFFSCSC